MTEQQAAKLLPELFATIPQEQRINVLHVGPALPETVDFFSAYRCKLFFVDPFAELPLVADLEADVTLQQRIDALFSFAPEVRFDICLFWDIFNYLSAEAVQLMDQCLRPYLHPQAQAHGFAVHNLRSPQRDARFSIISPGELLLRERPARLPGYAPLPQSRLKELFTGFAMKRTILLADSRLEMLLSANPRDRAR